MAKLHDQKAISAACRQICRVDSDFARAYKAAGPPQPRQRPTGFTTLLDIIVSQQLSTQAADTIMARVKALMPRVSAANLLALSDEQLRGAGLSRQKVDYARHLAEELDSGRLKLNGLAKMDDNDAVARLQQLRGIGRWSAEIYLMFSLGRSDIFAADDLALRVALGRMKATDAVPTAKEARALTESWSPWRSAGSLFLWKYYRHSD